MAKFIAGQTVSLNKLNEFDTQLMALKESFETNGSIIQSKLNAVFQAWEEIPAGNDEDPNSGIIDEIETIQAIIQGYIKK